jgi:hypothetical protein
MFMEAEHVEDGRQVHQRRQVRREVSLSDMIGSSFTEVGRLLGSEVRVSVSRQVLGYGIKAGFVPSSRCCTIKARFILVSSRQV